MKDKNSFGKGLGIGSVLAIFIGVICQLFDGNIP